MKALVLGGTRFVGLRLVRHLVSLGHDVTILNRGKTRAQLPDGIKRLYADRRDAAAFRAAVQGLTFDAVFDITGYDVRNLEPCVEAFGGRVGHYVFQSTCGVYLDSVTIPVAEDFPRGVSESAKRSGAAGYTGGKVQCEDYLLAKHREAAFPVTILRSPEIYGPENWMHEREFSFMSRLARGRAIVVPGNGGSFMHFAHVDDVARAHLSVIGRREAVGKAFNVAGPDAVTIDGYLDIIAGCLGVKALKKHLPLGTMASLEKPVFPFFYERSSFWSIQKARDVLGFQASWGIEEGLRMTCRWWQENLGEAGTRFEPGKVGCNVDLAYEDGLLAAGRGVPSA